MQDDTVSELGAEDRCETVGHTARVVIDPGVVVVGAVDMSATLVVEVVDGGWDGGNVPVRVNVPVKPWLGTVRSLDSADEATGVRRRVPVIAEPAVPPPPDYSRE